jgi:DNA repair exonuclease SbcCD nuclease subunit
MFVKFAHLSDCHLGAWRNDILNQMGYEAFEQAINKILVEEVDFVIISGDLFDISNPKVDVVDLAVRELKKLHDKNIPVYGIMGSHDFSPSDNSMIRPLISAGLFIDVSKGEITDNKKLKLHFFQDSKTHIKLTGLRARKRSLEIEDYKLLIRENLENEKGIKIFVLHTMLSELKPIEFKNMESAPKSLLPQNFAYYAGGHLHKTVPEELRKGDQTLIVDKRNNIIYPGALCPTNFRELEKYQYGGFCIVSGDINIESQSSDLKIKFIPIKSIEILTLVIDCTNKTVIESLKLIDQKTSALSVEDKIVTVRIKGSLTSGRTYEIKSNVIAEQLRNKGALEVLINKNALTSKEYAPISVVVGKTNEEIEEALIHEHAEKTIMKKTSKKDMENKIHGILEVLGIDREEGTQVREYNEELLHQFLKIFDLNKMGKNT